MADNEITVFTSYGSQDTRDCMEALVKGLWKVGMMPYPTTEKNPKTKKVACYGWHIGPKLREKGHDVLVLDFGYIGERKVLTSFGWNGFNGHGAYPDYPDDGGARFAALGGTIKPWKTGGDYALILGQVPGDASLQGLDIKTWYEEMARKVKEVHGMPVRFRPHPVSVGRPFYIDNIEGATKSEGALQEDLSGAAFTVCYNSNASVDSVLAGVPCVVGDKGSMAWEVSGHDISKIVRPAREAWAHKLAWRQWTLEEIASGKALERLFT